jgi:DNA-binding response OmpR family regulator
MAVVLVVDDEAGIRLTVQAFLERAGYQTAVAEDGKQALSLLDRTPPDLILADFLMPGLSGRRLLEQFRARAPTVPLIVMSGEPTPASVSAAAHVHAADYLCKPFVKGELLAMVENALRDKAGTRGGCAGEAGGEGHPHWLPRLVEREPHLRACLTSARGNGSAL